MTALGLALAAILLGLLLRAQRRHAAELRTQTLRDPLTGVENRRGFFARMNALLATPNPAPALPHALLLIDLDHFKQINDSGGHAFGDLVLGAVVDCMRRVLGENGTLARLRGEEFGALCPRIGGEAGLRLAENIRAEVAKLRFPQMQQSTKVTVSIGVALFTMANAATMPAAGCAPTPTRPMYAAKARGRDRVVASAAWCVEKAGSGAEA